MEEAKELWIEDGDLQSWFKETIEKRMNEQVLSGNQNKAIEYSVKNPWEGFILGVYCIFESWQALQYIAQEKDDAKDIIKNFVISIIHLFQQKASELKPEQIVDEQILFFDEEFNMDIEDNTPDEVANLLCKLFDTIMVEYDLCTLYGVMKNALNFHKNQYKFTTLDNEVNSTVEEGMVDVIVDEGEDEDDDENENENNDENGTNYDNISKIERNISYSDKNIRENIPLPSNSSLDTTNDVWYTVSRKNRRGR